jgi:hypothetical protein
MVSRNIRRFKALPLKADHFRNGFWLCENARTPDSDRRSYSFKTVSTVKLASTFNLKRELENVILAAFRSFAFLHSQGHSRRFGMPATASGFPRTADSEVRVAARREGPEAVIIAHQSK